MYEHSAPINCMPHYPPWGSGWGFDKQKFKCLTIWEGEFIKFPSIPASKRQLCGDLIKPKVKFLTLQARIQNQVKSPTLPHLLPRGDSGAYN